MKMTIYKHVDGFHVFSRAIRVHFISFLRSMYPFARDLMTDWRHNNITTTPFSLRKEGKQCMECKYLEITTFSYADL